MKGEEGKALTVRQLLVEALMRIWTHHRGKALGSLFGLLLGLGIMLLGVFWALFIAALVFAGYQVGKRFDEDNEEELLDILDRFLPPGAR